MAPRTPGDVVLDLGSVAAADYFPLPGSPEPDPRHPLAMWLCRGCGLAQIEQDDTTTREPLAVEPQALRDQAAAAVVLVNDWAAVAQAGVRTCAEFGSPHGGSWLPLFAERGWQPTEAPAAVVVDTFGLMHEPDQRAAIAERAARTAPDGTLLLLFHSLSTVVGRRQWNSLRHGHVGYYSLSALFPLLASAGLSPVTLWHFDLYGGTILLAARRGGVPGAAVLAELAAERDRGLTDPDRVSVLQEAADTESRALAGALSQGRWYAYGAASRAVAVLQRAGASPERLIAVADASPDKQGRLMPGTRIPIVAPADLLAADPDQVWLLLPDLLDEVSSALPGLAGRWRTSIVPTPGTA